MGDGSTNTYSFPFPVFVSSHLALVIVSSDHTTTYALILGTDYTVSGLSPNGSPALTGSIALVNSGQAWLTAGNLTTGYGLTIDRVVPIEQDTSIRNQGDFYPATIEDALDYVTMILQQSVNPSSSTIYTDVVTGYTYRLLMSNGVLSQQRLT